MARFSNTITLFFALESILLIVGILYLNVLSFRALEPGYIVFVLILIYSLPIAIVCIICFLFVCIYRFCKKSMKVHWILWTSVLCFFQIIFATGFLVLLISTLARMS